MKHLKTFESYSDNDGLGDWQQRWDQLMMDMEEEAEASGGPVASEYSQRMEEMEIEKNDILGIEPEDPNALKFNDESDWIRTIMNGNQLENLFNWVTEKRDEAFIRLRLNFYDIDTQDIEKVIELLNNKDFLYEMGLD